MEYKIGCFYCYDNKKQKEKSQLYFFDAANNFRQCNYCPNCGRKYGEVQINEQLDTTVAALEHSSDEY